MCLLQDAASGLGPDAPPGGDAAEHGLGARRGGVHGTRN